MRQWAGRRRKGAPQAASTPEIRVTTGEPASARQIARQLMTDDVLPQAEQNFVSRVLLQVPDLAECVAAAKRLKAVLRRKSKEALDKVLEDAAGTALEGVRHQSTAGSLCRAGGAGTSLDHQPR